MFKMKIKNLPKLIFSIIICEGAGLAGSVFTFSAITTWYKFLNRPSFSPSNSIFGPVWTILYALMGISVYLIWSSKKAKKPLLLFWVHLFFNATWSIMFFGLRNPFLGLVNILILWLLILIVIYKFWEINKISAILLLPYLIWVSFATILNFSILVLNP